MSTCPPSNQGCTPITMQLKALKTRILKMANNETCMGEEKIIVLLTNPQLQGNQKQKKYRIEGQVRKVLRLISLEEKALSQIHLKSHERVGNRMQCFHQGPPNRETSSRVLCSNRLIRPNLEDLFLKAMKITCSVKRDLNL